jgi:hypothetical protein
MTRCYRVPRSRLQHYGVVARTAVGGAPWSPAQSGGEGTFAGTRGNGEVAPMPADRGPTIEPLRSLRVFGCLPVTARGAARRQASEKPRRRKPRGSMRRRQCRSMGI